MGMLKYLDILNPVSQRLIDHISYKWDSHSGDKRSDLFKGDMTKDPIGLAYYHILESGIANNRMVPMAAKLSLLAVLSNRINKRQQSIPRGGRLGLWANETKRILIRETHKFDYRLWLARATDGRGETIIGLYKFSQTKRQQDTRVTDEDYLLVELWTFDNTGKMVYKEIK
jgi:hypothetical protein